MYLQMNIHISILLHLTEQLVNFCASDDCYLEELPN